MKLILGGIHCMENRALGKLEFDFLREQIVGIDSTFETPFGQRLMVYCDYTASGRCLKFIEQYIMRLQRNYANTHTEDDITGRSMTQLLHQAEQIIKESVNAGPHGRIISCGFGTTAAIHKFQQLIGVALSPVTGYMLNSILGEYLENEKRDKFEQFLKNHQPVVFIGPYEHHSNEVIWREGLATVIKVRLGKDGGIDLFHLEDLLTRPAYQNRLRIGSFSAASNVTGMISPVKEITKLLHRHNALACFDYAASAPYVKIDMNSPKEQDDEDPSIDAIFISPHKFLGGPGSSGVLIFNERIYHRELPPSVGGGGTVDYVGPTQHDFITNIEEREKAGTPGVLQTMRAALTFQVKDATGIEKIEAREQAHLQKAFEKWKSNANIEIMGNQDPTKRVAIASFNIKDPWGQYLHPKFITVLLNDLFGIQSRAGCACAGPYGHTLLEIDEETSEKYRDWIQKGYFGIKPGWCRVGFHYVMDDDEAQYVINAVDFIGSRGFLFLPLYDFDLKSGTWMHKEDKGLDETFSLDVALGHSWEEPPHISGDHRARLYESYLKEAYSISEKLKSKGPESPVPMEGELSELQFFSILPEEEQ
jgi:selenocysteine lyase/cysteine desulfurase